MKPRSKPVTETVVEGALSRNPSIFGGGKPHDELEYEVSKTDRFVQRHFHEACLTCCLFPLQRKRQEDEKKKKGSDAGGESNSGAEDTSKKETTDAVPESMQNKSFK